MKKMLLAVMLMSISLPFLHAQGSFFEGTFNFAIRLTGKDAQMMLENDPPKRMDMHIKGANYIISLSGGRIPRTMLFVADSNETYIVDAANRRAFLNTYYVDTTTAAPVAEPTGKTLEIKGIKCDEFVVKKPELKQSIYYYVSDQYKADMSLYEGKTEAKADFMTQGLDGKIPLRKTIKTPNLTTEIDLIGIKAKQLEDENFMLPEGFKIKKRDPRK